MVTHTQNVSKAVYSPHPKTIRVCPQEEEIVVCRRDKPKWIPRVISEGTFPSEVIWEGGAERSRARRAGPVPPDKEGAAPEAGRSKIKDASHPPACHPCGDSWQTSGLQNFTTTHMSFTPSGLVSYSSQRKPACCVYSSVIGA